MPIIQKYHQFGNENLPIYRNYSLGLYALQSPPPESNSEEIVEKQYPEGAEEQTLRFFNTDLAIAVQKKLNSKRPDITGAFVLRYLQSWSKAAGKRFTGSRVQNAVHRSLEQIQDSLRWMDKATVQRAIGRLERAFPKDFKVDRLGSKVMNYLISDRLIRDYFGKRARNLSVRVDDAAKHGVLEAVLIRNLEYKTQPENVSNPVTDEIGRIYGEMSAMALTVPRESRNADNEVKRAILPFGRQAVQESISNLKLKGVFIEHHDRRGFYTLDRGKNGDKSGCQNGRNRVSSNATELSPNATVVSSNATDLSPNATVSSVQIERERNEDRKEMESDKDATESSPSARSVESSNFDESELKLSGDFSPEFDKIWEFLIPVQGSTFQSIEIIPELLNLSIPVNLPLFIRDEFPELMRKTEREVARLKKALKTPVEPIHPDLLPFDLILDPEMPSWLENGLFLNPLTNRPIDWANFEEQIDIAVQELDIDNVFFHTTTKKDMLEFREHFKRHEGLSIPMVRKMLERIAPAINLPAFRSSKKEKVDHHYFARRINDLKTFNRYFLQLFRETFAPFVSENGKARFEQRQRMRWWPAGEQYQDGYFLYPLCESPENMPEPFRSILEEKVAEERGKLLRIEATQPKLQDVQVRREVNLSPLNQESPSGVKNDAFWHAPVSAAQRALRQISNIDGIEYAGCLQDRNLSPAFMR